MKLSICIFAYNHELFISEALEGVLAQKMDFDYEIVIGEDCSLDKTKKIIQSYKDKNPSKINVVFNDKNVGLMSNNIETILRCKGQYIALLDGDDYWVENTKLQTQVNYLDANLNYSFCFHDARILGGDGKLREVTCCGTQLKENVNFQDLIYDVSIPTCSIVFRRDAILDFPPPWFISLDAPDRPLNLLLAHKGKGHYFNKCWGVYRQHPGGSWTGRSDSHRRLTFLKIFRVVNRHFNNKYQKDFAMNENKVYYSFALELLRDKKLKRANYIFKKYISTYDILFLNKFIFYYRVILFKIVFLRKFFF